MTAPVVMALWTSLPRAADLIAAAVANPPPKYPFSYRFGETDVRYTGPIARELRRIHDEFVNDLMVRFNRREVTNADVTRNMILTPTKAIDEAREAAGVGRVDEGFWVERAAA